MTLIVSKIVGNDIYIHSDTKLDLSKINYAKNDKRALYGVLKTIIIHPFICISFAGCIDYAEEAVDNLVNNNIFQNSNAWNPNILLEQWLEILKQVSAKSKGSTDFLLASIVNKVPKLFKITNGKIESNLQNCWLGSYKGFEAYQRCFHNADVEKFKNLNLDNNSIIKQKMSEAFKRVISDPIFSQENSEDKIGNYHIRVIVDHEIAKPSHPVFLYDLELNGHANTITPIIIQTKDADKPVLVPILGSAAHGAYSITYLRTVDPIMHGVAIYYQYGNFGLLFCPQISLEPVVIKDIDNPLDFIQQIKQNYNLSLQGLVHTSDGLQLIDSRSW